MKRSLIFALALGACFFTTAAEARRFVDKQATCRAACGAAIEATCSGLRPGKFSVCRARTWNQCRRFGVSAVCPAPLPDLRGSYDLQGVVTEDACGLFGVGAAWHLPFTVATHEGSTLGGWMGVATQPASGTLFADHGWGLRTEFCENGCCYEDAVAVGDLKTPTAGAARLSVTCPLRSCTATMEGTVY